MNWMLCRCPGCALTHEQRDARNRFDDKLNVCFQSGKYGAVTFYKRDVLAVVLKDFGYDDAFARDVAAGVYKGTEGRAKRLAEARKPY